MSLIGRVSYDYDSEYGMTVTWTMTMAMASIRFDQHNRFQIDYYETSPLINFRMFWEKSNYDYGSSYGMTVAWTVDYSHDQAYDSRFDFGWALTLAGIRCIARPFHSDCVYGQECCLSLAG